MDIKQPLFNDHIKALASHPPGESVLYDCPAESVLRQISGKWKPQIMQLAAQSTLRFNSLLRKIPGTSKQSLSVALKELEQANVLEKKVVSERPLHIEYNLTDRGRAMMSIFRLAAPLAIKD